MPVMQNHSGRTFGRITLSEPIPGKTGYWKGKCSCGHPVQKRLDNLKRPGDHSCGKCVHPTTDTSLEERVRRLEQILASINPDLLPGPTPERKGFLIPSVVSEVREVPPEPRTSQFSGVTYDGDGELWEAHTLSGKAFFWGATEEEAAYAALVYLELIHCTLNHRVITDAELALPEERREEIRFEVSEGL